MTDAEKIRDMELKIACLENTVKGPIKEKNEARYQEICAKEAAGYYISKYQKLRRKFKYVLKRI